MPHKTQKFTAAKDMAKLYVEVTTGHFARKL